MRVYLTVSKVGSVDEGLGAIGERLRAARLAGRPPLRLADVAGERLTVGMLSKIERGRVSPSLGTLRYLAGRVGVPLAALFGEDGPGRRRGRRGPWATPGRRSGWATRRRRSGGRGRWRKGRKGGPGARG